MPGTVPPASGTPDFGGVSGGCRTEPGADPGLGPAGTLRVLGAGGLAGECGRRSPAGPRHRALHPPADSATRRACGVRPHNGRVQAQLRSPEL